MHSGRGNGDHMWAYQTTPDGMPSKGTSIVGMQERNPGLDNNTGGLLSVRPSAPPKPTNSVSGLHVRKTATYANPPQSSIVLTRKASPRATRHMKQRVRKTSSLQGSMLDATGTRRVPVEHYINLIRDSVHRIGVAAMPLIDQLCFSSRRAQIDGLFRLCPSIDITDAGKIVAYLQSNASEIEHLRTLTRGHSVIPVDHLKSPNSEIKLTSQVAVDKKATMRNGTALPGGGGAPGVVQNGNNRGNNAMRVRQAQAHARTHAPVFKFGKDATVPTVTDVQMIFSDLEKMKNQFVGLGRHTARPEYVDSKPSWSLVSKDSPMHPGDDSERFKTVANSSLPAHMRPTFKYMHPAQLGETNNFTKLRNFKKYHTDIKKTLENQAKERTGGRNAIHKPEFRYMNNSPRGSRRSNRTFDTNQISNVSNQGF